MAELLVAEGADVNVMDTHGFTPLLCELQNANETAPKRMAQTLIRRFGERICQFVEQGKACGELDPNLDTEASATLFIGTLQGLVMQSLLAGDVDRIKRDAPRVFAIYKRGIRSAS